MDLSVEYQVLGPRHNGHTGRQHHRFELMLVAGRPRGRRDVNAPSSTGVRTLISTPHWCRRCAQVNVSGVLDEVAALIAVQILYAHDAAGRAEVRIDFSTVRQLEPEALDVLAQAIARVSCDVNAGPFSPSVVDSLVSAHTHD